MNSGVYQILNKINGKSYVGSANNLKTRKLNHLSYLRRNIHTNEHLQKSWNKYGESSFEFKVLAKCPKEYCLMLEQWFIDNIKNLYNIQKKSNSSFGRICKTETIKKLSESRKNRRHLETTKEKIRISLIGNQRTKGQKQTEKTITSRINSNGYKNYINKKKKKILQMDLDDNLIKVFDSVGDCSKELKINRGDLSKLCNGIKGCKTYKGFKFKYI